MTVKISKRAKAKEDLLGIWHYTAGRWGEDQADRYLDLLDHAIAGLRDNPRLGADYGHVRSGYRRLKAGSHSIFYKFDAAGVEIVRVLHVRMDVDDGLGG